jgi:MoaA/NifB/PqqE/SkfB family radical SAM enzyme
MSRTENFCVAPWIGMYYHTKGASICCANTQFINGSPDDFLQSNFLRNIKQEFLDGKRPRSCENCWNLEDEGFISIRKTVYNTRIDPENYKNFTIDSDLGLQYLELRTSNLCNFGCRMCSSDDSNAIGKELETHPELKTFYRMRPDSRLELSEISDKYFDQLLSKMENIKFLMFTGGEPMLMKRYYELLDYCIEKGYSKNITLQFHTNASVYNPLFIKKLVQFENVIFTMSIDAVGKVAEYQRHGYGITWDTVKENCKKFVSIHDTNSLGHPIICPSINVALSAYGVLDIYNLALFCKELYNINNSFAPVIRLVQGPEEMQISSLNDDLRKIAIDQLYKAIDVMSNINISTTDMFINECQASINELKKSYYPEKFQAFVEFTKTFDRARNQSFEDTFNYKLY